jgi:hypothetical protein
MEKPRPCIVNTVVTVITQSITCVQCIVYSAHCTEYCIQCSAVQCSAVYCKQCIQCTLHIQCIQCTLYIVDYTVDSRHYTV